MVGVFKHKFLLIILLSLFFVAFISNKSYGTPDLINWNQGSLKIHSSEYSESGPGDRGCAKTMLPYEIQGEIEEQRTCISDTGPFRLGFYYKNNGLLQNVVGFGHSKILYKIEISGCEYEGVCKYIPNKDTLVVARQYLTVYKNFSSRLSHQVNLLNLSNYYIADMNTHDYVFHSHDGNFSSSIGSTAISDNGQWIVAELKGRGFLIFDTDNFNWKQITPRGYGYGFGMDPTPQLAISNDGNSMVSVGFNTDMRFYTDIQGCARDSTDDQLYASNYRNSEIICPNVDVFDWSPVGIIGTAFGPRFSEDNNSLTLYVHTYDKALQRVILTPQDYNPVRYDFLTLGDSFTSGEGENDDNQYLPNTNTATEKCHLSRRSYGLQMSNKYNSNIKYTKSVACSGATTKDILGQSASEYLGQGSRLTKTNSGISKESLKSDAIDDFIPGRIPQINFVEKTQPKVMFIGIGGNDVDLVGKLKDCISPGDCMWASDPEFKLQTGEEILKLSKRLLDVYSSAIAKSPSTHIYAVGYPQIISENGTCDLVIGNMFSLTERKFMREAIVLINDVIERTARLSGIGFIDIENLNQNHIICGDNPSYINALLRGDDIAPIELLSNFMILGNESFHPRSESHNNVANEIYRLYPDILNSNICPGSSYICPEDVPEIELSDFWNPDAKINISEQVRLEMLNVSEGQDLNRTIEIDANSFQPNSAVQVTVYSNKIDIGTFYSTNVGSLSLAVSLPETLDYGYHTLVLKGKDFAGKDIVYYQTFALSASELVEENIKKPEPPSVSSDINQVAYKPSQSSNSSEVLGAFTENKNDKALADISQPAIRNDYFYEYIVGIVIASLAGIAGFVIVRKIKK